MNEDFVKILKRQPCFMIVCTNIEPDRKEDVEEVLIQMGISDRSMAMRWRLTDTTNIYRDEKDPSLYHYVLEFRSF